LSLKLQMGHGSRLGAKPSQMCNVHYVHVHNSCVDEKEKNPMPPLVRSGLTRVGCSQLIGNVHTPHPRGVLQMNRRSVDRISNGSIPTRHSGEKPWMDARCLNRNCMDRNEKHGPLVLPHHTCNFVGVVHPPLQGPLLHPIPRAQI
jgi:hypothetical protein